MKKLITLLMIISVVTITAITPISADFYGYEDDYYYEYYEEDSGGIGLSTVAISVVVGFGISFVLVTIKKSAMRTVKSERTAKNYVDSGSLNLYDSGETYIRTSITRVAKKKD